MKERLLEYLRCLHCARQFQLRVTTRHDTGIWEGSLSCPACGVTYPIRNGVPRMIEGNIEAGKRATAARFGEEWHLFDDVGTTFEKELLQEYIHPLQPDVFRGALVLECGCGSGRNIIRAAEYGAKEVIGVDLSSSVEVAERKCRHLPNVHVIQCDMLAMPLTRDFDVVFSAGVLHHLPVPEKGFQAMLGHVKNGGVIVNNVYSQENNAWLERFVTPVRLSVTTRLPSRLLYYMSWLVSFPVYMMLVSIYKPLNGMRLTRPLAAKLFYNDYAYRMSRQPFQATWIQIYDQLTAPVAAFISREQIEGWVARTGVREMQYFWRNKNSWNFAGVK